MKEFEKIDDLLIEKYYSKLDAEEIVQFENIVKKLYGIITENR